MSMTKMDHRMAIRILAMLLVAGVVLAADSFWSVPEKSDYQIHPCKRDCQRSRPMICEYNFTLEHYQTLSRACYNCPHNSSDCHRPHCVPADGLMRAIKVVNRMMPGPAIHVCQDDVIYVNVYNQLGDFEGTAIHWHGVLQEGSPHMDGVAMITQCPIPVHSVFQYKFQAKNAGTHYWHAHAGMQRADGIFGALVVRDRQTKSVMTQYDHDLPEHTIIVQDWLDQYSSSKFSLHHHSMQDNEPSSILINGRGTAFGVVPPATGHGAHMDSMDEMSMTSTTVNPHAGHHMETTTMGDPHMGHHMNTLSSMGPMMNSSMGGITTTQTSFVPHSLFRVTRGRRYRFRLISNGILNCPLKVSVEKHKLTIIATDGNDIEPVQVDSVTLFAGERYDVVLNANQPIDNYWMYVTGLVDCVRKQTSQTAILRYQGAAERQPTTGQDYTDGDRAGMGANPLTFTTGSVTVADMTSENSPDDIYTAHNVKKFYLNLGYNEVENYRFLDPIYYPLSTMYAVHTGTHGNHLFALQINNITFRTPMSPVLSQFEDFTEDVFCNETSTPVDCTRELCECVHRIKVDMHDIVELVLVSDGTHGLGNHPMHMHGYRFYVLGMERLGNMITRAQVEDRDARGLLKRNFRNPIQKDTVFVPDGGYTIVRFKASNPGFWLFHCHVDFHFALGLTVVFQVGEPHEMTSTPSNFPRCGSWRFTQDSSDFDMCRKYIGSASQHFISLFTLVVFIISSMNIV